MTTPVGGHMSDQTTPSLVDRLRGERPQMRDCPECEGSSDMRALCEAGDCLWERMIRREAADVIEGLLDLVERERTR